MFIVYVTLLLFVALDRIRCENPRRLIRCFPKDSKIQIDQIDHRIALSFVNCTRQVKSNRFHIQFELERRSKEFDQHIIVTLFAGPCSSSTATLTNGRTFSALSGSLDGSERSTIVSSHFSSDQRIQQGLILYEYFGSAGEFADLASILIHLVLRHGREELIRAIYSIRFHSRPSSD